jgi:sugar transferase (PEP-CTERM system associated)
MLRLIAKRFSWRVLLLVACESALIMGAVALAIYIRYDTFTWDVLFKTRQAWRSAPLIALVCQVCLYYADLYEPRVVSDRREMFVRTLQALGVASLVLAAVYKWFPLIGIGQEKNFQDPSPAPGLLGQLDDFLHNEFVLTAALVVIVVFGWRVVFEWATRQLRARERLLIVGTGKAAVDLARELHERKSQTGVDIVGFVDVDPERVGEQLINPGIVGTIADIPRIARGHSVDRVVVSLADARGKLPMERLLDIRLNDGVRFDHLASVYEEYTGKIAVENLRPSWLIFSPGFEKTKRLLASKRAVDLVGSVVGLVLLSPLMLLVALAVGLTSSGGVLYHQKRVGRHGRLFTVHKFRSMCANAEARTGAVWAAGGEDPRVTWVGKVLRRTRLDELPQLWNVFKGDMSFVGPRPERPEFVQDLTVQIPFYGQRHVVKPGVTGWAQVRYTYGASIEDAMEKLQYDLFYIKNMSIALDLYIIFDTLKTVIIRKGS